MAEPLATFALEPVMKIPPLCAAMLALLLGACAVADPGEPRAIDRDRQATPAHPPVARATLPRLVMHKNPSCGCCGGWAEHMRAAGFEVEVHDHDDMTGIKDRFDVPLELSSCHTSIIDGYVLEGHVPADDIRRLLDERPDARGLILPGMPLGSPGMEHPRGITQPYTVSLLGHDGSTSDFSHHQQ